MGQLSAIQQQDLCRQCGLCCNGVIFANLRLDERDEVERLQSLLSLRRMRGGKGLDDSVSFQFSQPCAAFRSGQCGIYPERPRYCSEFRCRLLQRVITQKHSAAAALGKIARTGKLANEIARTLDMVEGNSRRRMWPLARRYREIMKSTARDGATPETAAELGRLTQSMHKLSLRLARDFYPGE